MSFLITSGSSVPVPQLPILYQSAGVVIAADEPAVAFMTAAGRFAVCFGTVQAVAEGGERLARVASLRALLADRIDLREVAHWVNGIEGRFVLAVVDTDGSLRVVADAFGKRDLFIRCTSGGVVLASGMDLVPDPAAEGYDQSALAHTLTYYGHRPPKQHTLYKAVRRLGVGEMLTVKGGELSSQQRSFTPTRSATFGAREHDLYADYFLDHLAACGSNDGNVVYLSSGWDSTSIMAGLVHVYGRHKVRAVIGRMLYSDRSGVCNRFEIEKAKKIADYFGVELDVVDFDHGMRGDYWAERASSILSDGHFFSLTGLNHLILAERAAKRSNGHEVVFAGEISDGAHNLGFSQFVSIFHPSHGFRQYADKMASHLFGPTFLREFLAGRQDQDAVYGLYRGRAGLAAFDSPAADPSNRTLQLFTSFFLRNGRVPLWSLDNVPVLTAEGRQDYTAEMAGSYLTGAAKADPEELYAWYLHLYNSFHWQGSTVATLQRTVESFGLVADLPYWDGRLQQFLSAMPEDWGRGLDLNPTKFPLKWMLQHRIDYPYQLQVGPHAYTYDVDPNFNHSVEIFYYSSLAERMRDLLRSKDYEGVLDPAVFDLGYCGKVVDTYLGREELRGQQLSDLVALGLLSQTLFAK